MSVLILHLTEKSLAWSGKKKSISAAGPKSCPAGKSQEEHINKVIHASRAQGMPLNSEGGLPNDMITVHNKQKTGRMIVLSVIEHEQINPLHQVCDEQQAGENSSDSIHVEQVQVACKAIQNNKKSTKCTKGNQKRQELPVNRSSPTASHHQPSHLYSQDAWNGDMLSASVGKS